MPGYIIDQQKIKNIYELDFIQNKNDDLEFDPSVIKRLSLIRAGMVFDEIFKQGIGSDIIGDVKVDGQDLRSYMKEYLENYDIHVKNQKDRDVYCKTFILFSMTEKNPLVTIERDGKAEPVYYLPGLDHEKDNGEILAEEKPQNNINEINDKNEKNEINENNENNEKNEKNEINENNEKNEKNEINEINVEKKKTEKKAEPEDRPWEKNFRQLKSINLSEYLPDDLSKNQLDEIMTRSGIENPTSEESVKFLLMAFYEHEAININKYNRNYKNLKELAPEDKKALGRRFIDEVKAHPVLGKVEKGKYPSEKLCVVGNIAWYGKLFNSLMQPSLKVPFCDAKKYSTMEGMKEIKSSSLGDYMFLADKGLTLSKRWRSRGGRNISTKDNPYGIDMGDAFIAGYSNKGYIPKEGTQPQCDKNDVMKFIDDMNWFEVLQINHMTMGKVLSAETDLKQRAYLKVVAEKHASLNMFNTFHQNYSNLIEKNNNEMKVNFILKGKLYKAELDVDSNEPNKLPEKYEYFSKLTDDECRKILATPYDNLEDELKDKIDQLMPGEKSKDKKFKDYHKNEVNKQFNLIQEANNNIEIYELDILKPEKINDPKALENLSEEEKQKIERVYDVIFGPLIKEEALFEERENKDIKQRGSKGIADIASHFAVREENGNFKYLAINNEDELYSEKQSKGYSRDEIVIIKAKVLQLITKEKKLRYLRYEAENEVDFYVSSLAITWKKPVKPLPVKAFEEPKKEEPKKEEPKKEKPKKEEPKKEEPKKDELKKEEQNLEEPKKENSNVSKTVQIKAGMKPVIPSSFAVFIDRTILANTKGKNEYKVIYNTWNTYYKRLKAIGEGKDTKLVNMQKTLEGRMKDTNESIFMTTYNLFKSGDDKAAFVKYLKNLDKDYKLNLDVDSLLAGKIREDNNKKTEDKKPEAKELKDKKSNVAIIERNPESIHPKSPEESRKIYARTMVNLRKANVMAIYAKQCDGVLDYICSENINVKDDEINRMIESLKTVSQLSDESTAQDAKSKIEELRNNVNANIDQLANADDPILKKVYINLKSFKTIAFENFYDGNNKDGSQKGIVLTEGDNRTFKDIITEEYPNMCRDLSSNEKNKYAADIQKTQRSMEKLLKKVRENVEMLENCNKYKKGNSEQFNAMFDAAEKAKNLSGDMSLMEIRNIMSRIMTTATIYRHKIWAQGIHAGNMVIGRKKGFIRQRAAQNLIDLATEILKPLHSCTDPYKKISDQIKPQVHDMNAAGHDLKNNNTKMHK